MLAVGMLLTWAGYSAGLWGWCLLRGYDVTMGQLMSPAHPYLSGKGQRWPPPMIADDVIFPGGRSQAAASGGGAVAPGNKPVNVSGGKCPQGWIRIGGKCFPPSWANQPAGSL